MTREATCINESVYSDALTRGKRYSIVEINSDKEQVRAVGDHNRTRWFPLYCFDLENKPVPMLLFYSIEDDLQVDACVEVNIKLSTGALRWCWFCTPTAFQTNGDMVPDTDIRFHYGNQHTIIVTELSYEVIDYILKYMDSRNKLLDCTLPFSLNRD